MGSGPAQTRPGTGGTGSRTCRRQPGCPSPPGGVAWGLQGPGPAAGAEVAWRGWAPRGRKVSAPGGPCPDPGRGLGCPGTHGPVGRAAARWGTETGDSHRAKLVRGPGPRAGLEGSLRPMPGTSTWHAPAAYGGQGPRLLITGRGGDWAGQGRGLAAGGSLCAPC